MEPPTRRRALLRVGVTALATAVAGCSLRSDADPTPETAVESPTERPTTTAPDLPFEAPAPGECEVSGVPRPTPVAEYEPRAYPQYPDPLTRESAVSYAADYEAAYQHNLYLATEANSETRNLSVWARENPYGLTEETPDGFLVGAHGNMAVAQEDYLADNLTVGVYYLTPAIALRSDIEAATLYNVESLRTVTVVDTQTIYCRAGPEE